MSNFVLYFLHQDGNYLISFVMKGLFILPRHQGVHKCCCICHEWWRRINYFCSGSRNEYKQNKVPNFPQFPARVFIFIQHTKLQKLLWFKTTFLHKRKNFLTRSKMPQFQSSLYGQCTVAAAAVTQPRPAQPSPATCFAICCHCWQPLTLGQQPHLNFN